MARERGCQKRGGGARQVSFDEAMMIDEGRDEDLVALDEALGELSQFDARMAQVVEMRFFGGLTEEEIAAALDVSTKTVRRDWRLARSWLRRRSFFWGIPPSSSPPGSPIISSPRSPIFF